MIGMILCGGLGRRFLPLTEDTPKALFELKEGYTLLDRQISQYKGAEIDRVILLTAHLSENIERRLGDRHMGVKIEYVREEKPLGTLNAIRLGMEYSLEDAVVSNGDVVTDLNIRRMCEEWRKSGAMGSIFVTKLPSPYGIVELKGRRITGFREKPLLDHYINGGFYCLSKRILPVLEKFKVGNIERTAFPELAAKGQLINYKEEGISWISIDNQKDLEAAREEYSNRTDKPWGYEKVLDLDEKGKEKRIYIMAGYRTSVRSEDQGKELQVMSGSGSVEIEGKRRRFAEGSKIRLMPNILHTIIAARNTMLREVSKP